MNNYLSVAVDAAKEAGAMLCRHLGRLSPEDINTKMRFDFVTKMDMEAERMIVEKIRAAFPEHAFYAEESHRDESGEFRWIIDPLDGTTNYIHAVPIFAVSIGLQICGQLALGVVYDPNRDELFHAVKGEGAFLNQQKIKVSAVDRMDVALLATGYPFRVKHLLEVYQRSFNALFMQVSGIRRAGSAALDLCYVACGRFDGFWELDLRPWDIAAAQVILEEAGGKITDFSGGDQVLLTGNTIASNTIIHAKIAQKVQNAFSGIVDR